MILPKFAFATQHPAKPRQNKARERKPIAGIARPFLWGTIDDWLSLAIGDDNAFSKSPVEPPSAGKRQQGNGNLQRKNW